MNQCPTESEEQKQVIRWAELQSHAMPELRLLHHIPNEAKRSPALAARLKAEGMKSGVPDLFLPVPRGGYHGLFVEMKRRHGGTVSDAQREWLAALTEQGYRATVCKGAVEAIDTIKEYLKGDKA